MLRAAGLVNIGAGIHVLVDGSFGGLDEVTVVNFHCDVSFANC